MNRQKKIKQINKQKLKKANRKKAPKQKSTYISKADRAAMAAEEQCNESNERDQPITVDTTPNAAD
jgi:hypothetical protein